MKVLEMVGKTRLFDIVLGDLLGRFTVSNEKPWVSRVK
jgi:hypothetical protein